MAAASQSLFVVGEMYHGRSWQQENTFLPAMPKMELVLTVDPGCFYYGWLVVWNIFIFP